MNLDALSRWLGVAANVGVVVGLLLLVFELNQNRAMMRAQTRNELAMGIVELMSLPAANSQLAGVIRRADSGEELAPDEQLQYRRYLLATYRYYENAHYQYRQGLYDEAEFATQKEAWRAYAARSPASVSIWCDVRAYFSPEFVAEMGAIIDSGKC